MNELRRHHRYTYAEYVALERDSPIKHEFLDGEVYAMAGGSDEHPALAAETIGLLRVVARPRSCRVYTSDLRIYVEAATLATFPNATVICGPLQRYGPGPETTALNPMILVEVTSDSSEEYDTGAKLEYYRMIPTLREYVIVSHRELRITVHARGSNDMWSMQVAIKGGSVEISSLAMKLSVDEIYLDSAIA